MSDVKEKQGDSTLLRKIVVTGVGVVFATALAFAAHWFFTPDFMQQATEALSVGDQDAAVAALKSHLQKAPDSTLVKLRIASILKESSPDEALEYLYQVSPADPQRLYAVQQIALLCLAMNRTDEAEKALLELIVAEPDNLGAQLALAELYFQNKKPEAALPHALAAARLGVDRTQTFLLIAEIQDDLQHPAEMIEPLQAALKIEPDLYDAHVNLAYAFHRIGRVEEAEQQARWCLQANPLDVAALRILASAERDQGRFDDAEKSLAAALQVSPEDVDCRILEADLLLYHRKPKEAYESLKGIYETQKRTVRYLGALARAAASAGDREEARRIHEALSKLLNEKRPAVSQNFP